MSPTAPLSQEFSPKEQYLYLISQLNTSEPPQKTLFSIYQKYQESQQEHSDSSNDNTPINTQLHQLLSRNESILPESAFLQSLKNIHSLFQNHLTTAFSAQKLHYFMRDLYSLLEQNLLPLFLLPSGSSQQVSQDEMEYISLMKHLNEACLLHFDLLEFVWRHFVVEVWQQSELKDQDLKYRQLEFTIHLVAKIYSMESWGLPAHHPHQQQSSEKLSTKRDKLLEEIFQHLTSESVSLHLHHLLMYKDEYQEWHKSVEEFQFSVLEDLTDEQAEEYGMPETQDLLPLKFTQPWNNFGVGCLLYAIFVEKRHAEYYLVPGLFQPYYYYQYSNLYVCELMQSQLGQFALIGQHLANYFLSQMENGSLQTDEKYPYRSLSFHFKFVMGLVNFMASCPDHGPRSRAYTMLNEFISKFNASGRMELLKATIEQCPFPSLLGLLLSRLKEELCQEYNALLVRIRRKLNQQQPYQPSQPPSLGAASAVDTEKIIQEAKSSRNNAPPVVQMDEETVQQLHMRRENMTFATKESLLLICEALTKYVRQLSMDSVDVLLHGLNTYYFLLLRDKDPNLTGVRDVASLKKWKDSVLVPVEESIQKNVQEIEELRSLEKQGTNPHDMLKDGDETHSESSSDIDLDELDELDLNDESLGLTQEEIELLQEDRSLRQQKQQMQQSEVAELGTAQRIQYEMRLVMLGDLVQRVGGLVDRYCSEASDE